MPVAVQSEYRVLWPDRTLSEVTVTYTVTAHGYGTVFEGEPLTVPVEQVGIVDSLELAHEASKKDP